MHLIEVIPCGPLARRFKPIKIMANTAGEAITGWSKQCGMADIPLNQRPVLEVDRFPDEKSLNTPTKVRKIRLYPKMVGGGAVGKILLGAALIAIAIWNPGIGGMILSQAGVGAVAGAGIGLLLGGMMQLFMKAPSVDKSQDPEPSQYIGGGRNSVKVGTPIGIGGGRMMVGGQIMSLQVNSSDLVYGQFPSTI